MPNEETTIELKRLLRATFPYLVFILVFIAGSIVITWWAAAAESAPSILPRAHAHNDYEHDRPLLDALDLGFCSVEADIHLVDGELLVAHDRDKVDPAKTLDALYLKPLWTRFEANKGSVYPEPAPFTLLIDIKSDGAETYRVLDRQLAAYAPMLTEFTDGETEIRAVTVIISGNRATAAILASHPRRAGIDGRLSDLAGPVNPHQMPLISDNWFSHFKWLGVGEMKPDEAAKLKEVISKCHENGVLVRFWAIPQSEVVWNRLYDAGVDLLNADDLPKLRALLVERSRETP